MRDRARVLEHCGFSVTVQRALRCEYAIAVTRVSRVSGLHHDNSVFSSLYRGYHGDRSLLVHRDPTRLDFHVRERAIWH